jgi:carbamoyl-phosphate synthase/aspartate carbamoyltransferase/dihydroorotase
MSYTKLPGLIDPHVHLRDPGATQKEDFETGTKAAVAGGIVAILDMPNNPTPTITKKTVNEKKKLARAKALCDWGVIFGACGNSEEFPEIYDGVPALKVYMDTTTGNLLIENLFILKQTFKFWQSNKPIIVHAEDSRLATAIGLSAIYNRSVHIAHISQRSELELIMDAKQKGIKVTCEVTPHHLFLTEQDAKRLGPYGLMKPPLRAKSDVAFLWKHIDAIDCIATDHAPHTKKEKEQKNPPFGVPGLETSLSLMLTAVYEGRIELEDVVRLMHDGPKTVFGIRLSDFSYVEVDLNSKFEIRDSNLFTKCGWSPFNGMSVRGRVAGTTIRGTKVYNGKNILVKPGFGIDLFG